MNSADIRLEQMLSSFDEDIPKPAPIPDHKRMKIDRQGTILVQALHALRKHAPDHRLIAIIRKELNDHSHLPRRKP